MIKLNTPGGSIFSMQEITGTILEAGVPVIVWVAPAGGFAASAGTFITLSGNIALMAPATVIGAASPVSASGEDIGETEARKVMEAVTNLAQSLARKARPARRLGDLDRRGGEGLHRERGGGCRRRRRDRGLDRRGHRLRQRQDGRGAGRGPGPRPDRRDGHRADDEPAPVAHPPDLRPEHRVPAVQPRVDGPARGAVLAELRDRHPRAGSR